MKKDFTALIILDGYGLTEQTTGNAIVGNSPYVDSLRKQYPNVKLQCSGISVGLPDGQMGNSEVGHLNMGAGRILFQELPRISNAIEDGSFFKNPALLDLAEKTRTSGKNIHLMGLLSDGGVHSTMEHLFAMIKFFKMQGIANLYVHCLLDGRDVGPTSATTYLDQLKAYMSKENYGKIATVGGRYYAMDRDNRWDRVEKAYDAFVLAKGNRANDTTALVRESYDKGITDEFVLPTVMTTADGEPIATINDGDGVVFFNFRSDRAREITRAFTQENFDGFDLSGKNRSVNWVCMTEYDETFTNVQVAFQPHKPHNTLGEYLSKMGKKQLRIAETEKYAHVTFFFNGGEEHPYDGEDRVLINSPKVATYDLKPEMSAYEVTDKAIELLKEKDYDIMVLNYANCDMVGHTGVFEAAQRAVRAVDACVKKLVEFIVSAGGNVFLTADHGNAEKMLEHGGIHSAHTSNEVGLLFVNANKKDYTLSGDGKLCDVAPTLLECMDLPIPQEMTGKSLLTKTN